MSHSEGLELFDLGRGQHYSSIIRILALGITITLNVILPRQVIIEAIMLIVSILVLVTLAPPLLDAGMRFSRKSKIPVFFLGLVIFPLLSSVHEIIVSIITNLKAPELAEVTLGQQFSNKLFEMVATFGIIAFFACKDGKCLAIRTDDRKIVMRNGVFMIIIIASIAGMIFIDLAFTATDGVLLIFLYAIFLVVAFIYQKLGIEYLADLGQLKGKQKNKIYDLVTMAFYIVGMALLGSSVADYSRDMISIVPGFQKYAFLIVGMSFALPNFVVSLMAIKKGEISLSVGFAIGSVIWELTVSTAILSFTGPILHLQSTTTSMLIIALVMMGFISFVYLRTHWTLRLWEALFIIGTYCGATVLILLL